MALVMEYCSKGMPSEVLKVEGELFSWDDPLLKWCMDTARAMRYLHAVNYTDVKTDTKVIGIMHRDLKPDNCLVTETYTLKVADFGEARAFNENNTLTQVGTPLYIAPEVVKGDNYGISADVFSYALTVLAWGLKGKESLLSYLFRNLSSTIHAKQSIARVSHFLISKGWRPKREMLEELDIPRVMIDLVLQCWKVDPHERPTFAEVLEYLEKEATNEILMSTQTLPGSPVTSKPGNYGRRRTSTSGALRMRILVQENAEAKEHGGKDTKKRIDEGIRDLVDLFDKDRDGGPIGEDELEFARGLLQGLAQGSLGNEEEYLMKLKGDELRKRIEEDEKADKEMEEASKQLKERIEKRKEKRETLKSALEEEEGEDANIQGKGVGKGEVTPVM
ncbi:hypothetical protein TrCOL_g13480 [Triparma columacea]|uniref:Protein kinase domain-containing protein n=1 Tax=Triparma columacea TaxID=722753 RepID=A0A9W7LDI1_9STRA|nr:hypothetical protein TrCOL_g13480 [Triparma columacea]